MPPDALLAAVLGIAASLGLWLETRSRRLADIEAQLARLEGITDLADRVARLEGWRDAEQRKDDPCS